MPNALPLTIIAPADETVIADFLTATLRWNYPYHEPFPFLKVRLVLSTRPDFGDPLVDLLLADNQTSFRVALTPATAYYWRITPIEIGADQREEERPELASHARFTTGQPDNRCDADDGERYRNPRAGAHWQYEQPVPFSQAEPLSPWYAVKAGTAAPPPTLAHIRAHLPAPVWDGHPEALEAWWYCWETLLRVWTYAPGADDHQAVANLIGYRTWGPWGSTMVWDTCFMLHFARYGAQAYPFISGLDNCYARMHENGFVCRESDRDNREVYVIFPVNPPLFAWAEWEWQQIHPDRARLERVLLPLVKHYEWWMRYQRRANGLYWSRGQNEADDSPRNELMHYAVSATSYQALAARYLAKIAQAAGRADLQGFFEAQQDELRQLVNAHFWDERHGIYNDLSADGQPITEQRPGERCKHVHMFWPLMAGLVPPDRLARVVAELQNPASFNRLTGIASLSADSRGYNPDTGQYWRGAVWPPTQCMVQEGLRLANRWDALQPLAERYYAACLQDYQQQGTMRENLAPDRVLGLGAPDFVGWAGIGPVANLVEYVLGLEIDAPQRAITWRLNRTERHGLQNLQLGDFTVDLISEARAASTAPSRIHINSGGSFTLRLWRAGRIVEKPIGAGVSEFVVGEA